jgi:hypothetical protein
VNNQKPREIRIGDYVQWESHGILHFPAPKRVKAFSECRLWAFVEGSNCGLPIDELYLSIQENYHDDKQDSGVRVHPRSPAHGNLDGRKQNRP